MELQEADLAVEVKGLKKAFYSGRFRRRHKQALNGVDLSVPRGAFWGILGPNGAGKTTLLSILSNLLTQDEGEVRVLGKAMPAHAGEICRRINITSGNANFLWSLTVRENLEYYAMLYGLSGRRRREKVSELLGLFGLEPFARVRFDELSTGGKQRLSLAKSLLNDPDLLFLDEPTVGIDPDLAHRIREAIQDLHSQKGTTILMTTHNMAEAESLCEQITFIKGGTIVAQGSPQELKQQLHLGDTIVIRFKGGSLQPSIFEGLKGVLHLQIGETSCRIVVDDHEKRLPLIFDLFMSHRVTIHDLTIEESDLEDVFIAFTR